MTDDEWAEAYHPLPNTRDDSGGFDYGSGCTLMTRFDALEVLKELNLSDDHLWTVIECDENLYISHGFHWVNSFGYILTENAPQHPILNDILMD